jgi:hypothetical protein
MTGKIYLALLFMELARNWQEKIDNENYTLRGNNNLSGIFAYISQNKQEVTLSSVAEHFHHHRLHLPSSHPETQIKGKALRPALNFLSTTSIAPIFNSYQISLSAW